MVGPVSSDDRDRTALRIKVVFSLVIGASAGLITLQGDVPLLVTGLVALLGTVVGALLTWFVVPGSGATVRDR